MSIDLLYAALTLLYLNYLDISIAFDSLLLAAVNIIVLQDNLMIK